MSPPKKSHSRGVQHENKKHNHNEHTPNPLNPCSQDIPTYLPIFLSPPLTLLSCLSIVSIFKMGVLRRPGNRQLRTCFTQQRIIAFHLRCMKSGRKTRRHSRWISWLWGCLVHNALVHYQQIWPSSRPPSNCTHQGITWPQDFF